MRKNLLISMLLIAGMIMITGRSYSQISFSAMDLAYTQNFNLWDTVHMYFSDNSTAFPGFYSYRTVDNTQPQEFRASNIGGSTYYGGGFYNFGDLTGDKYERACGLIYASASGPISFGFRFRNNTGSTIRSVEVAFWGEQWGVGNTASSGGSTLQTLFFDYMQASEATDLSITGYTRVPALYFDSPVTDGNRRALNGNLESNRTFKSATIEVTILPGEEIMLRWIDDVDDESVYDHRMAIDDLVVTPRSTITSSDDAYATRGGIIVYPNPVTDVVTIDARNTGAKSVAIYDMTGRRVLSAPASFDRGMGQLHIGNLPSGIYTIEIVSPAGQSFTTRFIRN